jgi:hypothetical protein
MRLTEGQNMKKNRKRTLSSIFAVFMLVCLSTTAAAQTTKQTESTGCSIDPTIHLTKSMVPILRRSLQYITSPAIRSLITEIISSLQTHTEVNAKELAKILNQLNLRNIHLHAGYIVSRGEAEDLYPGDAYVFPGGYWVAKIEKTFLPGSRFFGPAVIGVIHAVNYATTTITLLKTYNYHDELHDVYLLGFFGGCSNYNAIPRVNYQGYHLEGISPLIIVDEDP